MEDPACRRDFAKQKTNERLAERYYAKYWLCPTPRPGPQKKANLLLHSIKKCVWLFSERMGEKTHCTHTTAHSLPPLPLALTGAR